ncbi:MAG: MFS transporter [Rhizobiaceae bacterium]|nr:MFS transporter [Rhizobiaceae bacterium]
MRAERSFRIEALPLLFALAANAAAQSFVLVVLPALGRDLGFSPIETGLLLGLAALILLVSAPVWGRVSETCGRRFVLLTGLMGAAVGPALMAGVIALRLDGALDRMPTLALLFAIRAGQSILSGGLLPAAQAWMADGTPPERRAEGMGLLGASYGIGGIAGAGVAFAAGGDMPAAALMGLAAGVGIGFVLVRLLIGDRRENAGRSVSVALPLPAICPSLIVTFLGVTIYGIMQHVTALRLEDGLALPRAQAISQAGGALMGAAVVMALVQTFGLRLLKLEPARLMLVGASAAAIAMMGVAVAGNISVLIAALFVMGAALGLLLPGNLAVLSLIAGPQAQGRVAGVNAVAQGLGMAAGPIAGAALHRLSPVAPPIMAAAAMTAAVLAVLIIRKKGAS